jgi:glycosyltransferase involved in cell wall biosynthesis
MPQVCLVVPCFNEARRLDGDAFIRFLHEQPQCAICFVDDGSSDGTPGVLDATRARLTERVLVLALPKNVGKAEAVRQGVLHVASARRFALLGYWDADLSTPLAELAAMLAVFDLQPDYLLAMGSRFRRLGSTVSRSLFRHALGRVFATAASAVLELPVYDSQCGAKVFRAQIVDVLFAEPFSTPWLFDVELLARLRNHLGPENVLHAVVEVPLTVWREVGGSKMSASHMAAAPLGLLKIRRRYNVDH